MAKQLRKSNPTGLAKSPGNSFVTCKFNSTDTISVIWESHAGDISVLDKGWTTDHSEI